ncbi:MAG: hypothetical protein GHCLOJNM_00438 [bacterium]|nr:hypothetical protein [bacterium]
MLAIAIGIFLIHRAGTSIHWTPIPPAAEGPVLRDVERVTLSHFGHRLAWTDSARGALCTHDFERPGEFTCLKPPPSADMRAIEVLDGSLVALRSAPKDTPWEALARGWRKTVGEAENLEDEAPDPKGKEVRAFLERICLADGRVESRVTGATFRENDSAEPAIEFLEGRVSLSPSGVSLAWWRAREEVGDDPLSATVAETFEVHSAGPKFGKLFAREFRGNGTLSLRSNLLRSVGRTFWLSEDVCLILSFLDGGSLVPFDCRIGAVQATIPMSDLFRAIRETAPEVVYDPEGFEVVRSKEGVAEGVLFWARSGDSLMFFLFDPMFHLIRHSRIESAATIPSDSAWLARSQTLLVEDLHQGRLVSYTPKGERRAVFPLPPDWGDSFQILGEGPENTLLGFNRGSILRARNGDPTWETVEISR